MRGRWSFLTTVVRGRRVRRRVREQFQVSASALLYPQCAPLGRMGREGGS
jgi:hypothetical protein